MTGAAAGWLVAAYAAVQIPVSMIVPTFTSRVARPQVVVLSASALAAYLGLTFAPVAGDWLWTVLAGLGVGLFPVALTLIGLHSRHPQTTAALSAFVQSVGYVIAGSGPLLFGVIEDATGGWSLPLLFVALGVAVVAGWLAGGSGYVDDQLPAGPRPGRGVSQPAAGPRDRRVGRHIDRREATGDWTECHIRACPCRGPASVESRPRLTWMRKH